MQWYNQNSCHSCCLAHYQQSGMDKEEAAEPQPAQADCKSLRYSLNSCNECRERVRGICIANLDEIALDSKKCQSYSTNKYLISITKNSILHWCYTDAMVRTSICINQYAACITKGSWKWKNRSRLPATCAGPQHKLWRWNCWASHFSAPTLVGRQFSLRIQLLLTFLLKIRNMYWTIDMSFVDIFWYYIYMLLVKLVLDPWLRTAIENGWWWLTITCIHLSTGYWNMSKTKDHAYSKPHGFSQSRCNKKRRFWCPISLEWL